MASGERIRVAVGGQGRSGYNIHTNQLRDTPEKFEVAAIADQLPERREDAEVEFKVPVYDDWRPLLKEGGFDLFVNALPSPLHVDATIEALNNGYHVLCEKPMARTVADFDRMVEAAEKNGKELFPFQNNRVQPFFDKIQEIIATGVTNHNTRHPMVTAGYAHTMQSLTGGRFVLGLGSSGPQVIEGWHGVPFEKPMARTRDTIDICKKVWSGDKVTHEGKASSLPYDGGTGLGKPLKFMTSKSFTIAGSTNGSATG